MSYRKITQNGKVFICGFHGSGNNFKVWLRADTLKSLFDFDSVADEIRKEIGGEIEILHTDVWFVLTYPASAKQGNKAAELAITKIANRFD